MFVRIARLNKKIYNFILKTRKKILTDKVEIHIIELEKLEENKNISDDKEIDWLNFLINPESEKVKKKMEENKELKEAKEKLDKITEDERMQQLAWWREKAIYESNTDKNLAFEKGQKEAIKKVGRKMKKEKMPIETIIEITELTREEIENL